MVEGDKKKVQIALDKLIDVCTDAICMHESLLDLLPSDESEKHDTWFKAKMLFNNECIGEGKTWISFNEENVLKTENAEDDIGPNDSISNVESKRSLRSKSSGTSSSRIKVQADKAALIAQMAVLKQRHALEEQEQQLKRKKEELDLKAQPAAYTAKLEVLQAADQDDASKEEMDGMNSYFEKEKHQAQAEILLNPSAQEFKPEAWKLAYQNTLKGQQPTLPMDAISKERKQIDPAVKYQHSISSQLEHDKQRMLQPTQPHSSALDSSDHTRQFTRYHHFSNNQQAQIGDSPNECMINIMEKQNEITAALVKQQLSTSLPPRTIPIFEGDPLEYRMFIKAFEQGVEAKTGKADCLYYLEQFTRGQPQELVRSCQHMTPEHGYAVAKELLQYHFGNPYKIATAYNE